MRATSENVVGISQDCQCTKPSVHGGYDETCRSLPRSKRPWLRPPNPPFGERDDIVNLVLGQAEIRHRLLKYPPTGTAIEIHGHELLLPAAAKRLILDGDSPLFEERGDYPAPGGVDYTFA
jgi:hypothetical protein